MMEKKITYLRKIFPLLLIIFIMGCNLPTSLLPTATPAAAEETEDIFATISAAQTQAVDAAFQSLTQTSVSYHAATVTLRSSATSNVTSTPVASFTPPPTITPMPPITNTPVQPAAPIVVVTSAPSLTPTKSAYQCKITSISPSYNQHLTNGVDFDFRVTLENTGTETWEGGDNDFKYISGAQFQTSVDTLDLKTDVDPGGEVSFVIDMAATTGTGTQSTRWRLGDFCTVYMGIYVTE
ncbi:MAG: hypothetical protein AB9891_02085 [Anaerolineaceae bacterium]